MVSGTMALIFRFDYIANKKTGRFWINCSQMDCFPSHYEKQPRRPPYASVPVEAGENLLYPRHGKAGGDIFSADPRQALPLQNLD